MKHRITSQICFIGSDSEVRGVVRNACRQIGSKVSLFASAEDCLERLHSQRCDLIIVEMKLHNMGELILLHKVKKISPCLPVLIVHTSNSVRAAVTVMKMGAFDLIKKPLSKPRLLSAITSALEGSTLPNPLPGGLELTPAEKKVLCLILHGKSSRETADILHRSIKTVEAHRSHIMRKFDVDNIVDLVKQAIAMGLTNWPSPN